MFFFKIQKNMGLEEIINKIKKVIKKIINKVKKIIKKFIKKIKKIIKKIKKNIKRKKIKTQEKILVITNRILRIFTKVEKNKVLFLSDVREILGGNLELVYNMLSEDKYNKKVSLKADRRIKRTFKEEIKLIYDLTTAKYILLEDLARATIYIKLKKGQELCQLWHGAGAFKKFGYGREDILNVHPAYKKYTKAIVSSEDIIECYAKSFGITKDKVKATGIPRTDIFFDSKYINEKKEEIYKKYPILNKKKVILFAPTYRGSPFSNNTNYDLNRIDLDKIYQELKDEYVFVFKWHPAIYNNIKMGISQLPDISKYNGFYIDLSQYRDINDLLLVTDILVTDYSSVIFDYSLLNKPIVHFVYDLEDYEENSRGFYYEFEEYVYGDVAKTCDELIQAIKNSNIAEDLRKKFINKFMSACDGKATEKTCKWIFEDNINN